MPHADLKHRNSPLSSYPEVFDPISGNLNALIKQSAERMLPLLGDEIRVRSFCSAGLSPVVISPTQIEDIVGRLFAKAREEMQSGGMVMLQTARSTIPLTGHSDSPAENVSYVVVTFRYTAYETSDVHSSQLPPRGATIEAIRDIVEESRGFMSLDCIPYRETLINIYLPVIS